MHFKDLEAVTAIVNCSFFLYSAQMAEFIFQVTETGRWEYEEKQEIQSCHFIAVSEKLKKEYVFTLTVNKVSCGEADHDPTVKCEMPGKMGIFVLLTLSLILNLTHGHSLFTCEPITIPRCSGMAYNMTFFPNVMGHYDQQTAAARMGVSCSFSTVHAINIFSVICTNVILSVKRILSKTCSILHIMRKNLVFWNKTWNRYQTPKNHKERDAGTNITVWACDQILGSILTWFEPEN